MPEFTKHIFICMNQREDGHPRGCCDPTGQGELQRLFKTKLEKRGVKLVRANKSGCLDQCELGPTVVVYPDAVWYGGGKKEDVAEIVEGHPAPIGDAVINDGPGLLLIVENDLSFARLLLEAARERGFKGLVTSLGAAALAMTRDYKPDAVTLDICLPDIDGWRVMRLRSMR